MIVPASGIKVNLLPWPSGTNMGLQSLMALSEVLRQILSVEIYKAFRAQDLMRFSLLFYNLPFLLQLIMIFFPPNFFPVSHINFSQPLELFCLYPVSILNYLFVHSRICMKISKVLIEV